MRLFSNSILVFGISLVLSCSSSRQFSERSNKVVDTYQTGDYTSALKLAEQLITQAVAKGKSAEGLVYATAGKSAYQLKAFDKSREYLISAREQGYSDELLMVFLADNCRRIDNLSKEISLLEEYLQKYPLGKYINSIRARLFLICLESDPAHESSLNWYA